MLTPGTAFILAYLPARRVALASRREVLNHHTAAAHAELKRTALFASHGLRIEEGLARENEERLRKLAEAYGLEPNAQFDSIPSLLTTPLLRASFSAGETAQRVIVAASVLAQLAHLRAAAPDDGGLLAEAERWSAELDACGAKLTGDLSATELPFVVERASAVAQRLALEDERTPTTASGLRFLRELVTELEGFIESYVPLLNEPASAEHREQATMRQRLEALGARDVKFWHGQPYEVTLDASAFLARGDELFRTARPWSMKVRNARGLVSELMRSPLLGHLTSLNLDDQRVTDEDVFVLAASPYAANLRQLDLHFNVLTPAGVEAIAASPSLKLLEVVNLEPNPVDPVDQLEFYDESNSHPVPTEAGKRLVAKYGPIRWLRRR